MRQSAPGIFAAFDGIDMTAIEADQHNRSICRIAATTHGDPGLHVIVRQRHRNGARVMTGGVERALDRGAIRAHHLTPAVDHDLWRVYGFNTKQPGVSLLTRGRLGAGERILPTEPVPIIDMKR